MGVVLDVSKSLKPPFSWVKQYKKNEWYTSGTP